MEPSYNIRVAIRKLLDEVLRTDAQLDAFCLDFFFEEYRKHLANHVDRVAKINALMQLVEPERLLDEIRKNYPLQVEQAQAKLGFEIASPSKPGVSRSAPSARASERDDASPRTPPAHSNPSYARLFRTTLAEEIFRDQLRSGRIATLLQTHHGGGRTLARQIATVAMVSDGLVPLWLTDYASEKSGTADFYALLTNDREVRDQSDFFDWLTRHKTPRGILIILCGTHGPGHLLEEIAATVRSFLASHSTSAFIVVGGERLLRMRSPELYPWLRLFSPASFVDVPDLTEDEVAQLLRLHHLPQERAEPIFVNTGGHPGLVHELVRKSVSDPADMLKLVQYQISMSRSLDRHLASPQSRRVLQGLYHGGEVARLGNPWVRHDPTHYPESQLYFDGLLRADTSGKTQLRCPAVHRLLTEVGIGAWGPSH